MENREETINMLRYFWQEKGDLDRYTDIEAALKMFPEVAEVWGRYKMAEKQLTWILRGLE